MTSTSIFYAYINLSNIAILAITFVGMLHLASKGTTSKVAFLLSVIFAMAENVFDALWALSSSKVIHVPNAIKELINALYFITFCLSAYLWFVFSEFSFKKTLFKSKVGIACSAIPFALLVILLIINTFTGCLFGFDENGTQVRSKLFYAQQTMPYIYITILLIKHIALMGPVIKSKNVTDFYILISFCLPSIICLALQLCFKALPILSSAPVFSLLAMYASLLLKQAETDRLTGLFNGEMLLNEVGKEIKSLKANQNLYVMFIDVDSFKRLNDTRGHIEGNRVLKLFADILSKICLKNGGYCTRYGGDEFVVVQILNADTPIDNISKEIENSVMKEALDNLGYPVFVSVGSACFDKKTDDANSLIARADENMYKKKGEKHMARQIDDKNTPTTELERFYVSAGGNVYDTVQRLGGSEEILKKFLKKFLTDKSFSELERALSEKDVKTAFREAHTLKGVAVNLGLQNLFTNASCVTEFLRAENMTDAEIAMPALRREYQTVCKLIEELN